MDDRGEIAVPGARDVGDVLQTDPIVTLLHVRLLSPYVLGAVIAFLIIAMIVLGPSNDSRFIYTDF